MYSFILNTGKLSLTLLFLSFCFLRRQVFKDFFIGAACGGVAIALGESITDVKKKRKLRKGMECAILMSR